MCLGRRHLSVVENFNRVNVDYLVEKEKKILKKEWREKDKFFVSKKDLKLYLMLRLFDSNKRFKYVRGEEEITARFFFKLKKSGFDGERIYFMCSRCGGVVRDLYLPPYGKEFACRKCYKLIYYCQRNKGTDRENLGRYRALQRREELLERTNLLTSSRSDKRSKKLAEVKRKKAEFLSKAVYEVKQGAMYGKYRPKSHKIRF